MTARTLDSYPSEVRDAVARTRDVVAALHAELPRWDLVVWTAGNVSQRVVVDPDRRSAATDDLFVIKPSGVTYDELTPESMVVCDLDGQPRRRRPVAVVGHRGARLRVPAHAPTWAASCTRTPPTPRRGPRAARRCRAC